MSSNFVSAKLTRSPLGKPLRCAPYRGKEIGSRERLTETCIKILEDGASRELFGILPHICMIRSERFLPLLLRLLSSPGRGQQIFAAIGLGSLGFPEAVEPLFKTFARPETGRGKGCQSLQTAIICALGETGEQISVAPLRKIFDWHFARDSFTLRRKKLVLTAWGTLAQHGVVEALNLLVETTFSEVPSLRAYAVTEIGVAFWHEPKGLPDSILDRMTDLLDDRREEVRTAAWFSLFNLVQLGCKRAEDLFERV